MGWRTERTGLLLDRHGHPDYVHASGARIELKMSYADPVGAALARGMGTVYLARHPVLEPRAVKVLRPGMARDQTLVARFFEEARAADTIGHPNIIRIFDTGMLPDGCTPYIIMELLKGETLEDRLRREHRLSVQDAVEIACQTASAHTRHQVLRGAEARDKIIPLNVSC
jgi:serine/threonine protein kinase